MSSNLNTGKTNILLQRIFEQLKRVSCLNFLIFKSALLCWVVSRVPQHLKCSVILKKAAEKAKVYVKMKSRLPTSLIRRRVRLINTYEQLGWQSCFLLHFISKSTSHNEILPFMGPIKVWINGVWEVLNWESGGPGLNLGFATCEPYDLGAIHKPNDHSYLPSQEWHSSH